MRNSDMSRAQKVNKSDDQFTIFEPDVHRAVSIFSVTLLVLTNVNTYSSATKLGVEIQDGKLGKVVGQISSNKPNNYGEMLVVKLPVSKTGVIISCKKFSRPNKEANPDSLIPDIEVPLGEDILAIALEYMKSVK